MPERLDYSGYDFDTALAQLEAKLGALDSWKDRVKSATGQVFIRMIAYLIDMDGYKIDRRAEESYIDFARIRSSVVALVALVGYSPRRKVSSVTTLRFSTAAPPVTIPEGAVVATAGGVNFVTTAQGTITGAYIDLAGKQGDPQELAFVSAGTVSQIFTIPSTSVDVETVENTSVVVEVSGTAWTEVDTFVGQTSTAAVYTVTRKGTSLKVQFGDGANGKIPPLGVAITIAWLETLGASGDVSTIAAITTIVSPTLAGVTVSNTEVAAGGEEEEGIEEIRVNAPQVFATGDRAVTPADYRALLLAYPGVAKATAYGEQEQLAGAVSNPDYAWKVVLIVVPTGGGTINVALENLITAYLTALKVVTSYIAFQDPIYIPTDFVVQAKCGDAYDISTVQTAIETALDALVNFQDVDLGESLRYSDVVATIEGVTGVTSSIVEVFPTHDCGDGAGAKTVFASTDSGVGNIPVVPIDRGNVLVYIKTKATGARRRVGHDDGAGAFTSVAVVAPPRVTGGTINYTTGVFSITFNGAVTADYEVLVRYQTATQKEKVIGVGDTIDTVFTSVLERNLSPSFVDIYREGILIGSDDGAGAIVDAGGGVLVGGSVDYDTGDVQVTFVAAPATDAEISARFYFENPDVEVGVDQMVLMGIKEVSVEVAT